MKWFLWLSTNCKTKKVCEKGWEELFQRQFLPSFLSHHFRSSKNCNRIMFEYMEVGSRMKHETSTGKLEHNVDMTTWWTSKLSWFLANPNWRHWKQSYSKFPNTIRNTGFYTGTVQLWWFAAYIPLAHSEHSKVSECSTLQYVAPRMRVEKAFETSTVWVSIPVESHDSHTRMRNQ